MKKMKKITEFNNLSKEQIDKLKDIKSTKIDYCNCYPKGVKHPDFSFCDVCEKPVLGTDESILRIIDTLQHLTL